MSNDGRLRLHEKLCNVIGSDHVYYEPPENLKLVYPCIVYFRETYDPLHANNGKYRVWPRYRITYISTTVDDSILDDLLYEFTYIRHTNHFVAEKLHHDVYELIFD